MGGGLLPSFGRAFGERGEQASRRCAPPAARKPFDPSHPSTGSCTDLNRPTKTYKTNKQGPVSRLVAPRHGLFVVLNHRLLRTLKVVERQRQRLRDTAYPAANSQQKPPPTNQEE